VTLLTADARRLADALAAAVDEGDELRRLPDHAWKLLLEGGLLRALQPRRWGGGEVHFVEFLDAIMTISQANPSAGWVAGVIGVHPWQLALFDEQAQHDLWGDDPTAMHSSSYMPTGHAEPAGDGYRVSGRWSFSSGCDHCRAVVVGAALPGGEIADFRSFLLLRDQYRIEDNWYVAGLQGTGSKDIVVDDEFVPAHRTQSHLDYAFGAALPGQVRNDGPLYHLPWSVVFNMAIAASVLGSARGFIDTWTAESTDRKVAGVGRIADDPLTQRRLAEAEWDHDTAVTLLRRDADAMWDVAVAGGTASMADRARMRWDILRGCERVGDAVEELFRAASGRTVFVDHPLQRRYSDIQAGLSHAFFASDPLAKAVGGGLLGTTTPPFVL
jgi:3-hydroxy-9,10-secoandrosta-1,3,5(10)-triene-9,17-dione monooxygenase